MKYNGLLIVVFLICNIFLNAQENQKCATDYLHKKQIKNNPQLKVKLQKNEVALQKFIQNQYFNFRRLI